jgi:23S rRNA (adenine2503-C2)-methyltransferase
MQHFFAFTPETFAQWCEQHRLPRYRAGQVFEWVYRRGVIDPAEMTNLSVADRALLGRELAFLTGSVVKHQSATDGTEKLLLAWNDGPNDTVVAGSSPTSVQVNAPVPAEPRTTECVMIPSEDRRTACVSSQVGCPVGCKFCASGIGGLEGNLTGGRIVEQVWWLRQMMRQTEGVRVGQPLERDATGRVRDFPRITNVVFMGMGEPLANFGAVMHALACICGLWGHAISARKVTVSTVGLPAAIERLARECDLPITLALSLHAPTDDVRRQLIPWAQYSTIRQLLDACQRWFDKTGREITLEYTLLRGVNDRPEQAAELARLAKSMRANVNLIRYNENSGLPFGRPDDADVRVFQEALRERNVNVHIRASRGRDIAAACGQLRHEVRNQTGAGVSVGVRVGVSAGRP